MNLPSLIIADFGAAAVLITFGAVLGKCNAFQLLMLALIEVFFFSLNEAIGVSSLKAVDMGGSMYVHTFGAYFGLAAAYFIRPPVEKINTDDPAYKSIMKFEGANYISNLMAMLGTLFLWMFWPSFNGALANGAQQQRVIVNSVLSMACSAVAAFTASRVLNDGKLNMEIVLNSTLAGGVAIGSGADLVVNPWFAMTVGYVSGIISALGYAYLSDILKNKLNIHDTCGVHNLHGIPGILGGIVGSIGAATAEDSFGASVSQTFPAVAAGRSLSEQAGN